MKIFALLALSLVLAGCVTVPQNTFNPTATEQLLMSHAAEKAASGLNLMLPKQTKIFLDTNAISNQDRYLIEAIKAHLQGRSLIVVDDKTTADTIVSIRISADSVDDIDRVLGLPATSLPQVQGLSLPVTIPELSLYSEKRRLGIVELHAIAINAKTGELQSAVGPIFAVSEIVNRHVLTGFLFGDELERPGIRTDIKH